jgi:hypothetical protein
MEGGGGSNELRQVHNPHGDSAAIFAAFVDHFGLFVILCRNYHYKYDKCITYHKNYVCIL